QAGRRRWRTLAGAAFAALAFAGGVLFSGTDAGTQARYALGNALLGGPQNTAYADGNGGDKAPWRVTGLKSMAELDGTVPPASLKMPDGEWFGVDEEPGC